MNSLRKKPIVIAFSNKKGGVGKTTSTVNIASFLSLKGYKTLIIDLDPQGHCSSILGYNFNTVEDGISFIVKDSSIKINRVIKSTLIKNLYIIPVDKGFNEIDMVLKASSKKISILYEKMKAIDYNFDFIFIDFPPSISLLTLNGFFYSKYVIIPFKTDYLSMEGISVMMRLIYNINAKLNPDLKLLGLLPCMADLRTKMHFEVMEEINKIFDSRIIFPIVRMDVKLAHMIKFKKPIMLIDPRTHGTIDYFNITNSLLKMIQQSD